MTEYQKKYYQQYKLRKKTISQILQKKAYQKIYQQSIAGKITKARVKSKRRQLSFFPITNNPFPKEVPIEWHHINNLFVAPTPKRLHQSVGGKQHRPIINEKINNLGFNLDVFTK